MPPPDPARPPKPAPSETPASSPASRSSRIRYRDYVIRRKQAGSDERVILMGGPPASKKAAGGGAGASADGSKRPRSKKLKRSFRTLLLEFWKLLRGRHHVVAFGVATVTLSTLLGLIPPAATKVTLDFILAPSAQPGALRDWLRAPAWVPVPTAPRSQLYAVCAVLVGVSLVSVGVGIAGRYQMTRLTKLLQVRVRRLVFEHAVRLPIHRVHQIKSGGVASILREDAGAAAELLFSLLYNPWKAIVQLVGTLIILAVVDWKLLLGAIAVLPAAYFSQKTWISRIRPIFGDIRNTRTHIDAHAAEAFGGMRVVRGFNRERGESARFIRGNDLMTRQELLAWWWSRVLEIVWLILLPVASAGVLLYGGTRVLGGTLTLGDLMMFSFYLLMLLGPLESLTNSATSIQNQLAGFDRVLDLTSEPLELGQTAPGSAHAARPAPGTHAGARGDSANGAAPSTRHPGHPLAASPAHIRFRDVSFAYPGHTERVLKHISLDVPPGTTVALVGRSGAGKTTLCNLVARFYDPVEGVIELNGADVRGIPLNDFRRGLGIVEQDVFLFDGSVAENIGYARRTASPAQVRAAAAAAHADEFIERLEHGYDTVIGERGVRLSGGQKQRIAIARAILADPRILILDEATSNLDSESEALIQVSLARLMKGRTSFVIAHRLSTIRNADLIVVLEHGCILEQGSHEALLATDGRYAEMLELQLHPERAVERSGPGDAAVGTPARANP